MEPIKEITFERVYNAPLATVWEAWTNPEKLKQWWGPDNVNITECEVELHTGGKFYIVMEAGEAMGSYKGTLWPMLATFTTVETNSELAYTAQAWTDGQKDTTLIDQTTEIKFAEEEDGKTKINIKAAIYKVGPNASMAVEGMQYGFTQQLAKLENWLSQ
ncbi:MAG: ATPase [Candidatus Kaiserbacteria bacterium]|nr:ATPase [Candidatus Kaiserbacteria bacterium]